MLKKLLVDVDLILFVTIICSILLLVRLEYFIDDVDDVISFVIFCFSAFIVFLASSSCRKKEMHILRRVLLLFGAVLLAILSINEINIRDGDISENIEEYGDYFKIVGPALFLLWVFRTYDVQKQQENSNSNLLFQYGCMLADKEPTSQRIALEQLADMRRDHSFDKNKIDMFTRRLVLKEKDFIGIKLNGINLSSAVLEKTYLGWAYMEDTILMGANLNGANLEHAQLKGSDLRYSILNNAKLKGAKYSKATQFPEGFDPKTAGMILVKTKFFAISN